MIARFLQACIHAWHHCHETVPAGKGQRNGCSFLFTTVMAAANTTSLSTQEPLSGHENAEIKTPNLFATRLHQLAQEV